MVTLRFAPGDVVCEVSSLQRPEMSPVRAPLPWACAHALSVHGTEQGQKGTRGASVNDGGVTHTA